MENPLNECLCYKLQHLTRLLMVRLNDEIRPDGVTQGQLPVLCCLSDADGQTQAELCDKIQVEQSTMANTLRRMERDGLIHRTVCEKDKRQSRIFLTEQTRPTVEILEKKRDEVLSRMTRSMLPEELETFHRLLTLAMQALESPKSDKLDRIQER